MTIDRGDSEQRSLQTARDGATVAGMGTPITTMPHPIAVARTKRGWSVDVLAEHAGVHRATIVRLENRQCDPMLLTLSKIAGALGVPVQSLIEVREVVA